MFCQPYDGTVPSVSRRLSTESEVSLSASMFGQPVDIDLNLVSGESPLTNMPGYPRRSVSGALAYIEQCIGAGIHRFLIRMVEGGDRGTTRFADCMSRIATQARVLQRLRGAFPETELFIDPFGIALGQNDQWGVTTADGTLSKSDTERMWREAAAGYALNGADWVLTLGRFASEVAVAKRVIGETRMKLKVCTFSTNTETTQAYAYLPHEARYKDSGQKVLPQNIAEMLLWCLVDLSAGADMVIIKPSDNYHILMRVIELATCPIVRRAFLEREAVRDLRGRDPFVDEHLSMLDSADGVFEALWGAYAISGVYAQDMVIQERKGDHFLLTLLFERFVAIASAASLAGQSVVIFDRNAHRFVAA